MSCLAVAMPLFASAHAMAACVEPQGDYVGAGAGRTSPNGSGNATVFLSLPSGTTGTISTAMRLTLDGGTDNFTVTRGSFKILKSGFWENATSQYTGIDTKSCTGVLITEETIGQPGAAGSFGSGGSKVRRTWSLVVSDNGNVLTLAEILRPSSVAGAAASTLYTIRLEKQ